MTLSREEFKELYALYNKARDNFHKYADIIDERLLDELIFPLFNWLETKVNLLEEIMADLYYDEDGYPIDWKVDENGDFYDIICTNDLDAIYDKYFGGNNDREL